MAGLNTNTNTSAILYGDLLQLGSGTFGAGASAIQTITFSGTPAAGSVTLGFWTRQITFSTATGLPLGPAFQTLLNAAFAPTYINPFTVALTTNVYTITAAANGPFANMPLPLFTTIANTSATTITYATSTPGLTQETYATVNGVEVMPWPGGARDIETYMTLDTSSGLAKRKVAKFFDNGDVQFTVNMTNDATQDAVSGFRGMFNTTQTYDWRIVEPTKTVGAGIVVPGSTYYYSAYLSRFQRDGNTPDSRQRWNATLAIDGPVLEFPPLS
jgi:hypothetical protein